MRNKASLLPFIILGLVTILGCGRFTQQANTSSESTSTLDQPSNTFTLAGKEWKTFELDRMDIKVDLPGEPSDKSPQPSQLPAGSQQVFSSMRIYSYDDKDFGSSYTELAPTGKRSFEIKELADTSMAALKRQARDLEYKLDIKSPTNAKYDGTFTRNGKSFELKGCVVHQKANPARVWAVITLYPKDSSDGRTASQRIIESASFKGSSEECE
jgi:hypothetical protein